MAKEGQLVKGKGIHEKGPRGVKAEVGYLGRGFPRGEVIS